MNEPDTMSHVDPECLQCGGAGFLLVYCSGQDANLPEEVFGEDQDTRIGAYVTECSCVLASRRYEIIRKPEEYPEEYK